MFFDCYNLLSMSEYSKVDKEQYISVQKSDEILYNLITKVSNRKEKEYFKIIDTKYMLIGCKSLVSIPDKAECFKKSFRYIDDINDIFFGCNSLRSVRCRAISNKEKIWLEYKLYKKRLLNNHKENTFFYFQLVYKYNSHLRILGEFFVKNNINFFRWLIIFINLFKIFL